MRPIEAAFRRGKAGRRSSRLPARSPAARRHWHLRWRARQDPTGERHPERRKNWCPRWSPGSPSAIARTAYSDSPRAREIFLRTTPALMPNASALISATRAGVRPAFLRRYRHRYPPGTDFQGPISRTSTRAPRGRRAPVAVPDASKRGVSVSSRPQMIFFSRRRHGRAQRDPGRLHGMLSPRGKGPLPVGHPGDSPRPGVSREVARSSLEMLVAQAPAPAGCPFASRYTTGGQGRRRDRASSFLRFLLSMGDKRARVKLVAAPAPRRPAAYGTRPRAPPQGACRPSGFSVLCPERHGNLPETSRMDRSDPRSRHCGPGRCISPAAAPHPAARCRRAGPRDPAPGNRGARRRLQRRRRTLPALPLAS